MIAHVNEMTGVELASHLREKDAAITGTILAKLAHQEGTPDMVKLIVDLKAACQQAVIALDIKTKVEKQRDAPRANKKEPA